MVSRKNIVLGFVLAAAFGSKAVADPIMVTVSRYTDATFTTLVASGSADGFGNGPAAFSNGGMTSGSANPFAGTAISWLVTTAADVPGELGSAFLSTTTFDVQNLSDAATYFMKIVVDAGTYTMPGINRLANAIIGGNISGGGGSANGTAMFNAITLAATGTVPGVGALTPVSATSGGFVPVPDSVPFRLKDTFQLVLAPGNIIGITTQTTVTGQTPEPWNFVSVFATAVPVGLLYMALRRRKSNEKSEVRS